MRPLLGAATHAGRRLAARPLARTPRSLARQASSSVDDALRNALSHAAKHVNAADPGARVVAAPGADAPAGADITASFPGVRTAGPKMLLRFTCTYEACEEKPTITRIISKRSFEEGMVLVRCPSCEKQHLIADHLGWLSEKGTTIETMLTERGEEVRRALRDDEDLLHIDSEMAT